MCITSTTIFSCQHAVTVVTKHCPSSRASFTLSYCDSHPLAACTTISHDDLCPDCIEDLKPFLKIETPDVKIKQEDMDNMSFKIEAPDVKIKQEDGNDIEKMKMELANLEERAKQNKERSRSNTGERMTDMENLGRLGLTAPLAEGFQALEKDVAKLVNDFTKLSINTHILALEIAIREGDEDKVAIYKRVLDADGMEMKQDMQDLIDFQKRKMMMACEERVKELIRTSLG